MTTKVEFWSDHLELDNIPKTTFVNLKEETIKKRMREALERHHGDGDIWAHKRTVDRTQWVEKSFCFVRQHGTIYEDSPKDEDEQ